MSGLLQKYGLKNVTLIFYFRLAIEWHLGLRKTLERNSFKRWEQPVCDVLKFIAEHLPEEDVNRRWTLSEAKSHLKSCQETNYFKHV
jgi:hypothetical protein